MKRRPLWKVSIATSAEAEDAIAALLASAFGQPVATYTDVETGQTQVMTYLQQKPAQFGGWRADLQDRLKRAVACGLNIGPAGFCWRVSAGRIGRSPGNGISGP